MARLIQASGDYATEGEQRAATELTKLPANWTVIANKVLPASNGRSFEIDFVVIGDRHVFVLDEKGWRGRIHGSDVVWVRDDGSSERSPLNKSDYVAKVLAGHLRDKVAHFAALQGYPVVGGVLLTRATERPALRDPRAADGVFLLASAVEALVRRDASEGDERVASLRPRIEAALVDLSHRPRIPKAIGPYSIVEAMTGPTGSHRFRAEHADGGPRLLTMYDVSGDDDGLRRFYLTEFKTLTQLRDTGVVPEVLDPLPWSDDFLVVPSHPPPGTSLASLPRPDGKEAIERELLRAATAFRSLARVHAAGVIHRALGPEAIHVADADGKPTVVFSGFFAARRGDQTISPRLDDLGFDDPYVAPEIVLGGSYGFASFESDVYSLALVFLERLSGVPVPRLRRQDGTAHVPEAEEGWDYFPQDVVEETIAFFQAALRRGPLAPPGSPDAVRPSAEACAQRLEELVRRLRTEVAVTQGELLDRRYRVERVLGTGASARTFLATDTEADGLFALKQFLRPASIGETGEARCEFTILRNYPNPHLPKVFDVYPATCDVHVKLEYVDGVRLSDALPQYIGRLDRCRRLGGDILHALEHLEAHHLLHRDIKPDNVIIRDGGDAVLIDFGAATPIGARLDVAGTPGYLPPEAYFAESPPPSTDRYALGVLLFRALTGCMPFQEGDNPLEQRPLETAAAVALVADEACPFVHALLKAVAQDPTARYPTATAFREALLAQPFPERDDPRLPDLINPTVDQLRGLFRNSGRGNADNRGLDSTFALETYVPTALDETLLPAIFADKPRVVFFSGNPGDGKTAFLERIQAVLREQGGTRVSGDLSGWVWALDGHTYRACYDASEAHQGKSADEQLSDRLAGLEGDAPPRVHPTVLVAINDGRLADFLERHEAVFGWLVEEVGRAHDPSRIRAPGGVWLVDLKRRAYVGLRPLVDGRSVMRRVLGSFVAPERWAICEGCAAHALCPVRRNALALGATGDTDASARLEHLLLLSHLRGQRHVTMRDLRSGLAYLITGDLGCEQVHAARHGGEPLPSRDYWHSAFVTGNEADVMLGELVPLDPARYAQPRLERVLYFHQYAPFHTKVINATVRDATYVLDGLLYHESDVRIEEHYTDTAGFTDHVFALMHLLGFRFAPRIRDLAGCPPGDAPLQPRRRQAVPDAGRADRRHREREAHPRAVG